MSLQIKLIAGFASLAGLCLVAFILFPSTQDPVAPVPEPIVVPSEPVPESLSIVTRSIGISVESRDITVTTYGTGATHLLFVGGVHGGYEWNSSLLAYEMMDYLATNPDLVPDDLTLSVIPTLNPDGLFKVTNKEGVFTVLDVVDPDTRVAAARFNANEVDLNRNFACKWQPESTWRGNVVSAGTAAFSEPEAVALRDFVTEINPEAVVFWHSKANNVYASECKEGVLLETLAVMQTYADAGSYGAVASFDAYPITGDAEGWLASIGIPAVTVELETHNSIEWARNLAGVTALMDRSSAITK